LEVSGDPEKADKAWTDVIDLDPTNSYSWGNRGTIRLQQVQSLTWMVVARIITGELGWSQVGSGEGIPDRVCGWWTSDRSCFE